MASPLFASSQLREDSIRYFAGPCSKSVHSWLENLDRENLVSSRLGRWSRISSLFHPGIELKFSVDCQFTKIFPSLLKISQLKKIRSKNSSGSLLGIPIYPDKRNIDISLEKTPTYSTGYLLIKIKNIYTTVVVVS